MPKPLAVIDAETDPFKHGRMPQPFIWGFDDGERFREFGTSKELLDFLADKEYCVYAHNGGKFDYHLDASKGGFLTRMEPFSEVLIINGRLAKFSIGECEFRDSFNILPVALADMHEGAKLDMDYTLMEADQRHKHMPKIREYLKRDCRSLWEAVNDFQAKYGRGMTLAGSAMKQWRKISGESAPTSSESFYNDMMPYYYGGRVECFRAGIIKNEFKLVDINSAYPYAMMQDHPFSADPVITVPRISDKVICEAFYHVDAVSDGAFPFRAVDGLCFPSDSAARGYFVTGWELKAALDTKSVKLLKIHSKTDFAKTINFRSYIDHFYAMKKAAAKGSREYTFAKLFMNSLYGKFGANPEKYYNYSIVPPDCVEAAEAKGVKMRLKDFQREMRKKPKDTEYYRVTKKELKQEPHYAGATFADMLGPWALIREGLNDEEKRYYNLATAASITGFVRAYLWRHIHAVCAAGGEPLYCDTDSLAFKGGTEAFKLGKELGEWNLEGTYKRGGIGGKKLYAFQATDASVAADVAAFVAKRGRKPSPADVAGMTWKTASKGVRLSPEEILAVARGETVEYRAEAMTIGVHRAPRAMKRNVRATAKQLKAELDA